MSYLDDENGFGGNSGSNMRLNHPDDLKKYFSSKTFKDFLADKTSPLVYCTLSLDGKPFLDKSGFSINLNQHTNDHDNFTITVPDDALDGFQGYIMENSKNILGKNLTINLHRFGDVRQVFNGVVANVKNKKENGYGKLYISGYAPSILLENGKDCQSFENKTLDQIIKSATSEYPESCKVLVENPNTKYALPYTVQYKESDYQFIKRLATRYGEYFYYNGQSMVFGNKVQPIVNLEENIDLIEVEVEMNIKPQDFSYSVFDVQGGNKADKNSASAQIQYKENPFQAIAITASKNVYKKKPEMLFNHTGISDSTDRELKEAVRKERENRENLVTVKGKSKDPELKIGGRAKLIDINGRAMETYRITEIKHYHDGNTYYNEFVGIPDLFNAPYQDEEAVAFGEKQSARVIDNNDPSGMGRVRVQYPWQEKKGEKSPWIRLVQPHSGSGKGFHFIPEIGEEVLVDFESGNAEKPFVVGTQYNGSETSGYGTSDNSIKAIHTRSGHILKFTEDESIILTDKSGNEMIFDTVGSNITVTAPETMTFNCKNMNINVGQSMTTNVGRNQNNIVGMNQVESIGMMKNLSVGANFMTNIVGSLMEFVKGNRETKAKEVKENSKRREIVSQENNNIHSQKNFNNNSGDNSKMH
ncbi:type VI secretion system Vgr family protein [Chryseobacterium luquanense]|uniref:Type VI secretion system tip protein VgrG n=1 Tax=Chryseobacterium luquanense TaxID=2983766 RepID=A0ABT3XZT8_9FLAO|nr:type VI secretion system tip protein VgrG [Chryseobacterium luquanense]MCX8531395.1 type VI secretion system tip protein VgrG [Chryseobacterium luquanense]